MTIETQNRKLIGAALKALRERSTYTQTELAQRLGVLQITISRWETGKMLPNLDRLPLMAQVFGTTPAKLAERIFEDF